MATLELLVLLRIRDLIQKTGMSRSTIYRRIADGSFPPPVHPSPGIAAWRAEDIRNWLDRQQNQYKQA